MSNLVRFLSFRNLASRPIRAALGILGIFLGVLLFTSVRAINHSVSASFRERLARAAGEQRLTVRQGEASFEESVLPSIEHASGVARAVPVVETRALLAGTTVELRIVGLDLTDTGASKSKVELAGDRIAFLNSPDSIIVSRRFAQRHGLALRTSFEVATPRGKARLVVRGLLKPGTEGVADHDAFMDIDAARIAFEKRGKLDSIEVELAPGAQASEVSRELVRALGPSFTVEKPEQAVADQEASVRAFQLMLSFFAALALISGLSLVANAAKVAVSQRRLELARLRALGATRLHLILTLLGELAVMGLLGSLPGALAGRALASSLLGTVAGAMAQQARTRVETGALDFGPGELALIVLGGALVAMLAGLVPALKTLKITPLDALAPARDAVARDSILPRALAATSLLAGFQLSMTLGLSDRHPAIAAAAQAAAFVGTALLGPLLVVAAVQAIRARFGARLGATALLALDNILRNPARTRAGVASLVVSLALVIQIASARESFLSTMRSQFDGTVREDLIVSSNGQLLTNQVQPLHEELSRELLKVPGIEAYGLRLTNVDYAGASVGLKAYDESAPELQYRNFALRDRPVEVAGRELYHSSDVTVFVSESFRLRFGKTTGDVLALSSPSGPVRARIVGEAIDFSSGGGFIVMSRDRYKALWRDPLVTGFGIRVLRGRDAAKVQAELEDRFGASRNLMVTSNRELRRKIVEAIESGFAFCVPIEGIAIFIGLLGLLNELHIGILERRREIALLRSIGMAPAHVTGMILAESAILGVLSSGCALLLGGWVAHQWILHALASAFGWVVQFHLPLPAILAIQLGALLLALFAASIPAWTAARAPILEGRAE